MGKHDSLMPVFKLDVYYNLVTFQLQYVDYTEGQWTAPVMLTEERANKFLSDYSVARVKLKILSTNTELDLELK